MSWNSKGTMAAVGTALFLVLLLALLIHQNTALAQQENQYKTKTGELGDYIDLAGDANWNGIFLDDPAPGDIMELRAWNTKAFPLFETSEIRWRVYQNRIHFFDGEFWIDLNRMSYPAIEKKDFVLGQKPQLQENKTRFKIANYLLHQGIAASVNAGNEIIFADANKAEITRLAPAYAIDANQNLAAGQYSLLQKEQKLEIFVDINAEWLDKAAYPVLIDPDTNYLTSKADGYLTKSSTDSTYIAATLATPDVDSSSATLTIGQYYYIQMMPYFKIYNGYVSFDTRSVSGTVTGAKLGLKIKTDLSNKDFNIMVYDGTCIGSNNLGAADWNACVNGGTYDGNLFNTANSPGNYNFAVMSIPIAAVKTDGNSQFELTSNKYIARIAMTGHEDITFYSAESSDANSPYLEVTTTSAPSIYRIDPNQMCIAGGGTGSSGSYGTLIAVGQPAAGEASSAGYVTRVGCIYTRENNPPVVGQIQICDGTCGLAKTLDPATEFSVRVVVTDIDSQGDVNTESFRISLYTATDTNNAPENWDHNNMKLLDDNITLGTRNGCVQSGSTYCLNIPALAWTTKFKAGDANIYVAVDDNSYDFDANALTAGALAVNETIGVSQDTNAGTYSAAPSTTNNAFTSTQTGFAYIDTNHNGNVDLNVTIRATDLNVSSTIYIGDGNQSWNIVNSAPGTAFTGLADLVLGDWNRGNIVTSDSNSQKIWYWLAVPNQQPVGDYNGTLTYNSSAS